MSMAMVNVISGGITETQRRRTKFDGAASTSPSPHLEVVAWVHDVGYDKDVWIDLYLFDSGGGLIGSEMVRLDYQGLAGGEGGLFALSAPVAAESPQGTAHDVALLQYRLYYRVNDAVFTDGILHTYQVSAGQMTNAFGSADASAGRRAEG